MATLPKISIIAEAILYKLFASARQGHDKLSTPDLQREFNNQVPNTLLTFSIETLREKNFGWQSPTEPGAPLRISKEGYLFVERQLDDPSSFISTYEKTGDDWLFESGGVIDKTLDKTIDLPSTNTENDWEPLPIDREDPATSEVIEKLEVAFTAIQQDNGYPEKFPEERNFIVQSLQSGLTWLKTEKAIFALQIQTWIVEPLGQAAKRFGPSVVGAAVAVARELVVAWLKKKMIGG